MLAALYKSLSRAGCIFILSGACAGAGAARAETFYGAELLNKVPPYYQQNGYLAERPATSLERLLRSTAYDFVLPGGTIMVSSYITGFLFQFLKEHIDNPVASGMFDPLMGLFRNLLLGNNTSVFSTLLSSSPHLADAILTLLRGHQWAGPMTDYLRFSALALNLFQALSPELSVEYQKWRDQDTISFHLNNITDDLSVTLERPSASNKRAHITLEWLDLEPDLDSSAGLLDILQQANSQGYSALRLYPESHSGGLRLTFKWNKGGRWTKEKSVDLTDSRYKHWWTEFIAQDAPSINQIPEYSADPLSPELIRMALALSGTSQSKQATRISDSLLVQAHQTAGIAVLTAADHLNIWLTPGESGFFTPMKTATMPVAVLEQGKPWDYPIHQLNQHISESMLPGWARLPWHIARLGVMGWFETMGRDAGRRHGHHIERQFIFKGHYKKWNNVKPLDYAEPVDVEIDEENILTGYLYRAGRHSHRLVIVYHNNNQLASSYTNAQLYAPNIQSAKTYAPRQVLAEHDVDVFFPEYPGYNNDIPISSKEEFLDSALKAYDFIANPVKYSEVSIVGYSLGSGLASYVASKRPVDNLILVGAFSSLRDAGDEYLSNQSWLKTLGVRVPEWFMRFNFDNRESLAEVSPDVPIYFFHGNKDSTFSRDHPDTLISFLRGLGRKVRPYFYPEGNHTNLFESAKGKNDLANLFRTFYSKRPVLKLLSVNSAAKDTWAPEEGSSHTQTCTPADSLLDNPFRPHNLPFFPAVVLPKEIPPSRR